ncbi:MAG: AAA family ATPase [Deltaproteobacteria bacterium]|jgi:hypothetical protein|nr:AAA family ATPase [Deltaproteobacteria bacterium]
MKKLPLKRKTFSEIIESKKLYVDKTEYIHRLVTGDKSCFLSRPRRFGKSLLLDAIKELFVGRRDLFKGLYIETSTDYDFPMHPVIELDMSYAETATPDLLKRSIKRDLVKIADREWLKIPDGYYDGVLISLVKKLSDKYGGTKVVVLVDECDAPVAANIGRLSAAEANQEVLQGFYTTLKKLDEYLRFVFVVGATRCAVGSSDGEYNDLVDISLKPEYSGICGFTSLELDQYFGDHMQKTLEALVEKGDLPPHSDQDDLKKELVRWYGGYNWGSEPQAMNHQAMNLQEMNHQEMNHQVLNHHEMNHQVINAQVMNPFSILNFFNKKEFSDYWFQSGPPANLTELIQADPLDYLDLQLDGHNLSSVTRVELHGLGSISALFHGGYLTIDEITMVPDGNEKLAEKYSFKFPNHEVGKNYKRYCLDSVFTTIAHELQIYSKTLVSAFLAKDPKAASLTFQDILSGATFPQDAADDGYHYNLIRAALLGMNFELMKEPLDRQGGSDLTIILPDDVRVVVKMEYRPKLASENQDSMQKELAKGLEDAKTALKTQDCVGALKQSGKKAIMMGLAIYDRKDVSAEFVEV